MTNGEIRNHAAFISAVADLLRGTYKQSDYGKVILPFTVLRRLDCVLEPTWQSTASSNRSNAADPHCSGRVPHRASRLS